MNGVRRPVSVKEVAAAAGVSVGTVSNVLNRPESVAEATRARVLEHMRELGFVRNESARLLRAGRSRVIGFVVLDVGNPFFTDVARGAEEEAQSHGISLVLCNSDQRPDREQHYLEMLEEQRVHGVLITPTDGTGPQLELLQQRGTPVVLVDRTASGTSLCSVAVDDVRGGELVLAHAHALRHRRLAFVGGPFTLPQVRDRYDGFTRGASDVRTTLHETTALNVAEGRRVGEVLASTSPRSRPTLVFCANDLLALGVLQSLTKARLRVPEDVALVGYDDIDFAAAAAVPLTSVRQPRESLGRTATRLLFEESHDAHHDHQQIVFEPELQVRASSELPRGRA